MKAIVLALVVISLASVSYGQIKPSKKKQFTVALEHLALGAGTEIAISQSAGGANHYPAGLVGAGLVAGFKEGSDAVSGRDSKKMAALHALTIVAGAGIAALVWHSSGQACHTPGVGVNNPAWVANRCER